MKKILLYAFVAASVFAVSCEKSEIETFDTTYNYVQFCSEDHDEEHFLGAIEDKVSFSLLSGATETTYGIDIEILGKAFDKPTEFKVSIVDSLTTAVEGTHFEALKDTYTFPAGEYKATLPIKFLSTKDMDTEMFNLHLEIVPCGNVLPGTKTQKSRTIGITNMLVQPEWWPKFTYVGTISKLLGGYTDARYKYLIAALTEAGYDVVNTDFANFTYGDFYDAAQILSNYIKKNQPVDEDGELVSIPFPY